MVLNFRKEMANNGLAFFGGMLVGGYKFAMDHSIILMASKTAAIIEGCGTALLFGAFGVLGKHLGTLLWNYLKTVFKKDGTDSVKVDAQRPDGHNEL